MSLRNFVAGTSRFDMLDAIRGFGALCVVAYHAGFKHEGLWIWGWMDFFFVLSGLLITRTIIISRGRGGNYKEFLVYRAARLFPVMIAMLVAYEVLIVLLNFLDVQHTRGHFDTLPFLLLYHNVDLVFFDKSNFANVPEYAHFWSLMLEEHFYIFWGAVLYFAYNKILRSHWVFLGVVIVLLALAAYLRFNGMHWWVIFGRYDGFLVGSFLGVLLFGPYEIKATPKQLYWLNLVGWGVFWLAVARLLNSAVFSYLHPEQYGEYPPQSWLDITCYAIISAGSIIGLLKLDRKGVSLGVPQKAMMWVGGVSYELYVTHYPIALILRWILPPDMELRSACILVLTLLVGLPLSYWMNELLTKPALKSRHKVIALMRQRREGSSA